MYHQILCNDHPAIIGMTNGQLDDPLVVAGFLNCKVTNYKPVASRLVMRLGSGRWDTLPEHSSPARMEPVLQPIV